jgi:hypothetical protein
MIVIKRKRERAVTLPAERDPHPALLLFPLCWNMVHSLDIGFTWPERVRVRIEGAALASPRAERGIFREHAMTANGPAQL